MSSFFLQALTPAVKTPKEERRNHNSESQDHNYVKTDYNHSMKSKNGLLSIESYF